MNSRRQKDIEFFHTDSCPTSIIISSTTPRHTIVNIPQIYSLTPFQPPFASGSPKLQTKTQATQTDPPTPSGHRQCRHPELHQHQPKPQRHQAMQSTSIKPSRHQAMQPMSTNTSTRQAMQPEHMKPARDNNTQSMHMKPSGDHNMPPAHMKPSRRQIAQPMRVKPPAARRPMLPNNKRSRRRRPRRRVYHPTLPSKYRAYNDL